MPSRSSECGYQSEERLVLDCNEIQTVGKDEKRFLLGHVPSELSSALGSPWKEGRGPVPGRCSSSSEGRQSEGRHCKQFWIPGVSHGNGVMSGEEIGKAERGSNMTRF